MAETVRMSVGDRKTLSPSELPSLVLAGQPSWTSSRPSDVQIVSTTMYSCTIEAVNSFTGYAVVQCQYYYRELDPVTGQYIYQRSGYKNYNVFVEGPSEARSISIYPTSVTLGFGETLRMEVTVQPSDADQTVTWTTTDRGVATVNSANILGANGYGTATVTASTANGLTASCAVTVKRNDPTSVSLQKKVDLILGESFVLKPILNPEGTSTSYTWESDDSGIASVSSNGTVTAISVGETNIRVRTANNLEASSHVVVKNAPEEPVAITINSVVTISKGYYVDLIPKVSPECARTEFLWTSDNSSVVVVDKNGRVFAQSPGTAIVTVSTDNGLQSSCRVTVSDVKLGADTRNVLLKYEFLDEIVSKLKNRY